VVEIGTAVVSAAARPMVRARPITRRAWIEC
jgi:hypothetical protein